MNRGPQSTPGVAVRGWLRATLALATVALPAVAEASPSARLVYARTPEASSCPDETALRSAVAARLGYDPFFPWARQTMLVQVWREAGRYRARLQLVDGQGVAHGTRTLTSDQPRCAELLDATALAISIAMNSMPKDEPEPTPAAAAPEPAASALAATTQPAAPAPAPAPSAAPAHASVLMPTTRPASATARLGIDVFGALRAEPEPTAGLAVFGEGVAGRASLGVELRADAPASTNNAAGAGRVRAWTSAITLAPCARWDFASLCALGAVGLLRANGEAITDPRSAGAVFGTVGGRLAAEWPMSSTLALRAHVDADVDLRRATLQVSGADAWTAPLVSVIVGVGVAARFE